ncbi:MAG TPA: flagellar hook-associated protein FlgK [Terriglobales bacterium]|nr:flagellar hook-associated protein FlgK [Terriglobales bacterium]
MSSLFASLSVAVNALHAEQGALDATANNVANANTPGFSRERPVFTEGDPVTLGALTVGTGVILQRLEAVRDPILQLRIDDETQQQGRLDALVAGMNQLQVRFSASDGDIGNLISKFFASINQLSTDPGNLALRQGVLLAAGNVASAFRNTYADLQDQRTNLDLNVIQDVNQVNSLSKQISGLNAEIVAMQNLGRDPSALEDQRQALIEQLGGLIDVATVQSESGLTLTTRSGSAMVVANQSFALSVRPDSSGLQRIYYQGSDITGNITSGELSGLLQLRDEEIPGVAAQLDTLAAGLANQVNAAHHGGFDLSGTPGGDLFVAPSGSGVGAAGVLAVQITDPARLAASSDSSSPGDNGNLLALAAVRDQAIGSGSSPTNYYSSIIFGVGNEIANDSAELDASKLMLRQLQDQRSAVSGVSLDEEATNLIRYQRAYEASARLVTVINDMLQSVINLGKE